jgi:hypothetical protein
MADLHKSYWEDDTPKEKVESGEEVDESESDQGEKSDQGVPSEQEKDEVSDKSSTTPESKETPESRPNFKCPNFSFPSDTPKPDYSNIFKLFEPIIHMLLQNIFSSSTSSTNTSKKSCQVSDFISHFNNLYKGLDTISNPRLRGICFMDRLNQFQEYTWEHVYEHVSNNSKKCPASDNATDTTTLTLNLIRDKIRGEISNVMEQLNK